MGIIKLQAMNTRRALTTSEENQGHRRGPEPKRMSPTNTTAWAGGGDRGLYHYRIPICIVDLNRHFADFPCATVNKELLGEGRQKIEGRGLASIGRMQCSYSYYMSMARIRIGAV